VGTITTRKRRDGTLSYTAQIRLKRDGKVVHSEAETFDRKALANEWLRRRETELDQRRARGEALGHRWTVGELLTWYDAEMRALSPWGRTKAADLLRLKSMPIAAKLAARLTQQDFVEHATERRKGGAGPATVGNDLIWLRLVLRAARAHKGIAVDLTALDDAVHALRGMRLIGKSKQRNRRLLPAEETKLFAHFRRRDARARIPMAEIMAFALESARRQDEITRMLRADLRPETGTAWLDDVKHPRQKIGNRREFKMTAEAWAIVNRQPDTDARVFPYDAKSIGAAFTRACQFLGIDDLHFHDLRHEATSRLFERGYSIQEVAQFTLHDSWATLKRYTHLKPADVPDRRKS
jgi:integrase